MSGTMTPDNLSRESSPVPESNEADHQPAAMAQPAVPKLAQIHHDIRYSQSAPGSPSGKRFSCVKVLIYLKSNVKFMSMINFCLNSTHN